MAGEFITCDNRHQWTPEALWNALMVDDGTGCPAIKTSPLGGAGGGITFDFELNCVIDTVTEIVYLMRVTEDDDNNVTIDYINAQGQVVVPPNPGDLAICNANDALMAILSELETLTEPVTPGYSEVLADGSTANGLKEVSLQFYGAGGTLNGVAVEDGKVINFKSPGGVGSIPYTVPTIASVIDSTTRIVIQSLS